MDFRKALASIDPARPANGSRRRIPNITAPPPPPPPHRPCRKAIEKWLQDMCKEPKAVHLLLLLAVLLTGEARPTYAANSGLFWSATLNAAQGFGNSLGYSTLIITYGSLSDDDFDFRGTTYEIKDFFQSSGQCWIQFNKDPNNLKTADVKVKIGTNTMNLSSFTKDSNWLKHTSSSCGLSLGSNSVSMSASPDKPTDFTVTPADKSMNLKWTDPSDTTISKYQYRQKEGSNNYGGWTDIGSSSATTTTHTVTGLTNGTQYTFKIRAVNSVGDGLESDEATATATPPPAAPTNLAATVGNQSVALKWTDPSDTTISKYQYRQKEGSNNYGVWTDIGSSSATTTSHTITGLTNETEYTFQLRAVNPAGAGSSSTVMANLTAPGKPSNFTAQALDGTRVFLGWTNPSNASISKYQYRQKEGSNNYGGWTDIGSSSATTTSHTVTGLTSGTQYTFKIRAVNPVGNGTESDEVSVTPRPRPAKPSGFAATAGDQQVLLEWTDPSDTNITTYQIRKKTETDSVFEIWGNINKSGANTTSHTVGNLTTGVEYSFQIRAVNSTGGSPPSDTAKATPLRLTPDLPSQAGLTYGTGRSVSHQLPAATGGNAPLSYALTKEDGTALPAWLSFAAATRTLSGTTPGSAATASLKYAVTDADGETDSATFSLAVESNSQPAVTAPSDQAYSEGRPITDLVLPAATGGNGALSYALARTSGTPALPPGLSFDAATRTLSGTPSGTQAATGYTYTATDADGDAATATFTIAVAANSAPDLPSQAGLTYGTGRSVSHQLPAATGGNAPLSYALTKEDGTALPAWLSFAAATRTLSGTTPGSAATASLKYAVTDADGETDSATFSLAVESNSQPAVTAPSDQAYSEGRPITDLVLPAATGGNGALSYALARTSGTPALPPGLSFDAATRTLSGTPSGTQAATGYTYTATDADGDAATATFTIAVAANSAPDLPSQAGLTYGTGRSVSHQLPAATGGNAPLSYALTKEDGTALPAWLSFAAATRTLSGTTPGSAATASLKYAVTDADGETDSATFSLAVESNSQPAVTAPSDQAYSEGRPITDLVLPAATGGNGALSYALARTSGTPALPPGLSFDAATRTLSGTPSGTQAATGYTYTATDADGDAATATFTIAVAANSAPDLPSQAGLTYGTGRSVSHQLPAATGGNAPLSYALTKEDGTALPAWLSFAAATRTLSGTTPGSAATASLKYAVTDADGETDSATFSLAVESNSQPAVTAPSDQAYSEGRPITDLVLPAATGGNGALSYALARTSGTPALPPGLSFDAATRTLSGTPSGTQAATGYTYTATDADGDAATATFTIAVAANSAPDLPSQAGLTYGTGRSVSHQLPAATGGNAPLSYALTKEDGTALPAWLSFAAATRTLSGTTPGSAATASLKYAVTDADGETDSATFSLAVESNSQPAVTAPSDQAYSEGRPITDLVLPAATGGNGALSYALARTSGTPALPPGLSFDAATRTLSGTPSGTQAATGYTYTATDADGDAATATFTIAVAANSAPDLPSQAGLTYGTGRSVSHQLPAATGGNAPLSYALTKEDGTALPAWLSFAAATRTLSGTTPGSAATASLKYAVTDADGETDSATFSLAVESNSQPAVTAPSDQAYSEGRPITDLVLPAATGGNGALSYALARTSGTPALPPGLSFDAATRTLSGTPSGTQAATGYTYTATDADGDAATATFTIAVAANSAPDLPSQAGLTYGTGRSVSHQLPAATGGNAPLSYALTKEDGTALPAWLSFAAATRTLSGTTPGSAATASLKYAVTDADGETDSATFSLAVESNSQPAVTAPSDQAYSEGRPITDLVLPAATGGNGALSYALARTSGTPALPPGLSFDAATRTLSGTPSGTQAATGYTYTATDADGDAATATFTIAVAANSAPDLPSQAGLTYGTGRSVSHQLPAATGGNAPLSYALTKEDGTALPAWLSFAAATRTLSGTTPGSAATASLKYAVTDADGETDSATFSLAVESNSQPAVTAPSDQAYSEGRPITDLVLPAATGGNGALSYALARTSGTPALPPGLSFDAATRTLSGTPSGTQAATGYTYTATDADGDAATATFTIAVAANSAPDLPSQAGLTYGTGRSVSHQLPAATGGNAPLSYALTKEDGTALPAWLSFAAATRTLSGTTPGSAATASLKYAVTDADGETDSATFSLAVESNSQPAVTAPSDQAYSEGRPITDLVLPAATGGNGALSYALARTSGTPALPPGLSFDAATRTLSGTPSGTQAATGYTYTATDADGDAATATFTIAVAANSAPDLPSQAGLTYGTGRSVSHQLPAATGGNAPLSYALTKEDGTALPAWLSFAAATRTLSGTTPGSAATASLKYAVTDADGETDSATFSLAVESNSQPAVTAPSDQAYSEGRPITDLVLPAATGGNGALSYALARTSGTPALPPGLSFDAATRTLSGTPSGTQAATGYTYTATDADGDAATATFTIAVAANSAPDLPSQAGLTYGTGRSVSHQLPAATGGNAPLSYALTKEDGTALPAWLSFAAATRTLSGTTPGSAATASLKYAVTDADGETDSATFSLAVESNSQPAVTAPSDQAYSEGRPITDLVLPAATGGNGALSYALARTSGTPALPPGLSFDAATRTLSGTPSGTQAATGYTYTATDADGDAATATFTIAVAANSAPDLPSQAGLTYGTGRSVSHQLPAATGGNAPLSYALTKEDGTALPAWLSFAAATRTLSGTTPGSAATASLKYAVTDADGETDSATFSLAVESNSQPAVTAPSDQAYSEGRPITDLVLPAATGGNGALSYALARTSGTPALPPGLSFDAATRTLSGTPSGTQAATGYTYTATDADGDAATATFTIAVAANSAPDLPSQAGLTYGTGRSVSHQLPAATGGNAPLSYALTKEDGTALPAWLSFAAATRTLSGTTPGSAATASLKYAVTDADGETDSATFSLAVESNSQPAVTAPSDQAYSEGRPITDLVLPAATGGNGALSYALARTSGTPALPPGLSFDAATRTLSGTPSGTQAATGYTYTATDADGDAATATFTIAVAANSAPDLPSQAGLTYGTGRSVSHQLPAATGGNAPLSYALTKEDGTALPAWLSFAAATRTLSGTTPGSAATASLKYAVTDADGETDSATFSLAVESNSQPAVTAPSDQAYSEGRPITDLVLPAATGGNGALSYALARTSGTPALPPGLSFDAATRTLSGTPSGTQAATGYTYTATDADGDAATATFTIAVAANSAPDLPSQAGLTYGTGRSVSHQLPAATGGNAPLSYALTKEDGTALPAWLSFAAATRTLSGTTPGSAATASLKYAVTDADGETDSATFSLAVESNSQPAVTAPSDQAYSEGRPITDLVLPAATGGNGALSYALARTSGTPALPPGLSFDAATRTLSGTPSGTQAATGYTYTATDADGDAATATFTIAVAANSAPDLPSQAGLTYGTGRSVSHQLPAATGGNAPLSYALTKEDGTALPAWLSFAAATRTLSGTTPGSAATASLKYAVTDADGETDSATFSLAVESNSQPAVTAPSDQAYSEGRPITDLVLPAATGGNGALSYALARTSGTPALPPGLSFDAATRTLSGTPSGTQAATGYTYTATDADGDAATATFTIAVAANSAPDLPSQAGLTYGTGRSVSHQLPAATGGNAPLSYALTKEDGTALPAWLSFAAATRTLSGTTPGSAATASLKYAVTDADGETDSATFSLAVESNSQPAVTAPSDQAYSEGRPITDLVLPAATGGNGALSYALARTSGTPALPPGLSFDAATRTLSGTPSGTQAATGYTYTATDADGDAATATFTIMVQESIESPPLGPPTLNDTIADQVYARGRRITDLALPLASGGNGALSYALARTSGTPALPPGLSFDAATRTLSGTPSGTQAATGYTYTATDADGNSAAAAFTIAVQTDTIEEKAVLEASLSQIAGSMMASTQQVLNWRFAKPPDDVIRMAGLEPDTSESDRRTLTQPAALDVIERFKAGSVTDEGSRISTTEWLLESTFDFSLNAGSEASHAQWSVWGQGDYTESSGEINGNGHYESDMRSFYVGVDARIQKQWIAGVAVSHRRAHSDYSFGEQGLNGSGTMEMKLTSVHPYAHVDLGDGVGVWMMLGAGEGDIELESLRSGMDSADSEHRDLSMQMASVGLRRELGESERKDHRWALMADAGYVQLEADGEILEIDDLTANAHQVRAGMEYSRTIEDEAGNFTNPYAQAFARYDGGNGSEGVGLELAGGMYFESVVDGWALDVQGRWLAAHSESDYEERGVSVTLKKNPDADGRGLSLMLSPRWGAPTDSSSTMWEENAADLADRSAPNESAAMGVEVGYGMWSPWLRRPIEWFGKAEHSSDLSKMRLGVRFGRETGAMAQWRADVFGEHAASNEANGLSIHLKIELMF